MWRRQRRQCRQQNRCHSIGIPFYLCAHIAARWVVDWLHGMQWEHCIVDFVHSHSNTLLMYTWCQGTVLINICLLDSPIQMSDKTNLTQLIHLLRSSSPYWRIAYFCWLKIEVVIFSSFLSIGFILFFNSVLFFFATHDLMRRMKRSQNK